jgi:hypothetical protein
VTWGLGGLAVRSHRTLVAGLADDIAARASVNEQDIADRWCDLFWPPYDVPAHPELYQTYESVQGIALTLLAKHHLGHASTIPIREAIDFIHACIYSTIKALKFSSLSQICGGPIELAAITTDRSFRWVRHKQWDAAIREDDI